MSRYIEFKVIGGDYNNMRKMGGDFRHIYYKVKNITKGEFVK